MNIQMQPTVTSSEIYREMGIDVMDCEFAQECGNDSYITLWLDSDRATELWKEIEFYKNKFEDAFVDRMKNELELIKKFRDMGYTDSILVFVSW